ncbi:helix-turn-helix domain-containing protein [Allokutzneria sp. A3M-2-11 16]|uniref:ArsR/SmtB family transcription factor n=1 Tax=Allokutzneria sp. A3M-2-11 16 TaxID=2962043 RepID=UPI0020B76F3B|nr:helix-turn-helix domain-containing protein [Allokutzneria sp. A3M-2-11 16]MCP3804944.1 helix-turn-helix domain-containing protein [Allokutzneria sp. A3M-2-11 16]
MRVGGAPRPPGARWQPPEAVRPLFDLFSPKGELPDFVISRRTEIGAAIDELATIPATRMRTELMTAFQGRPRATWLHGLAAGECSARAILLRGVEAGYRALVEPKWAEIASAAHTDLAHRGRILLREGLARAIASLPSTVGHRGQVVDVDSPVDRGVPVDYGLVFAPSCLLPGTLVITASPGEPVTVVYPAPVAILRARTGRPTTDSLSALLGSRRAAVLRAAAVPRGTTELAAQAGISLSSASEHASALRNAGLIMTTRAGRKVLHTATELADSLMAACDPPLVAAR